MMRTVRGGLAALVVAGLVQSVGSLALVTSADAAGTTMRATTAVNVRSGSGTALTGEGSRKLGNGCWRGRGVRPRLIKVVRG